MFQVIAILGLILLFSLVPWALKYGDRFSRWIDQNVPPCRIEDGKLITEVDQPYFAGDKAFLFVLDTKGHVEASKQESLQGVLFTGDQLVFWVKSPGDSAEDVHIKASSLEGLPNGQINGAYFQRLVRSFLWVWFPLLWGVIILAGTLSAGMQALFFSVIATWLGKYSRNQLPMNVLLNVALHAVAPAAIVFTLFAALRLEGIDLWIVYLVAYGVFLFGATNACREQLHIERQDEKFPSL